MSTLIVNDDQIRAMGQELKDNLIKIQDSIDTLLNILADITQTGITGGATADAVKAFKGHADGLKNVLRNFAPEIERVCNDFIGDVDSMDRFLY